MSLQIIMNLIPILCQIESSNNHLAVGDGGKAVGILQIHEAVIDDVNRVYGTDFSYTDRRSIDTSKIICLLYLGYWGRKYYERFGKEPDIEILARIWNGGPKGFLKRSTDHYWSKVEKELSK